MKNNQTLAVKIPPLWQSIQIPPELELPKPPTQRRFSLQFADPKLRRRIELHLEANATPKQMYVFMLAEELWSTRDFSIDFLPVAESLAKSVPKRGFMCWASNSIHLMKWPHREALAAFQTTIDAVAEFARTAINTIETVPQTKGLV